MSKLWKSRIFQWIIFVIIAGSIGLITGKLQTLQFIFEKGGLPFDEDFIMSIVNDIKMIKLASYLIWGCAMGLYINFMNSLNRGVAK